MYWREPCAITGRSLQIDKRSERTMNVVLGIDGGGTHTRASIVEGDRVAAFAESGSIKRLRVGAQAAEENLRAVLTEVYKQSGVKSVRAACVGVASATMPG